MTGLAQYEDGVWAYQLPDALDSVRQLSDAAGQIELAQSYDPFGNLTQASGSAESGFGYTGEQEDPSAGLVFLRQRYYDPTTGQFLSKDPYGGDVYHPQTLNPYLYVLNNPINDQDPSGELGEGIGEQINEFLLGAAYQFIANNYDALLLVEKSLFRPANLDQVRDRYDGSIAFQLGRIAGSGLSAGQGVQEIGHGLTLMGCGGLGELGTGWTGIGAVASTGVIVVGAAYAAHGLTVGVVSAVRAGDITGNVFWMVADGGGGGSDNWWEELGGEEVQNVYPGKTHAPNWPSDFTQANIKKVNVKDKQLLEQLRKIEGGQWKKIYENGYSQGKKISIHYFLSPSGKVFDLEVHSGWSHWWSR